MQVLLNSRSSREAPLYLQTGRTWAANSLRPAHQAGWRPKSTDSEHRKGSHGLCLLNLNSRKGWCRGDTRSLEHFVIISIDLSQQAKLYVATRLTNQDHRFLLPVRPVRRNTWTTVPVPPHTAWYYVRTRTRLSEKVTGSVSYVNNESHPTSICAEDYQAVWGCKLQIVVHVLLPEAVSSQHIKNSIMVQGSMAVYCFYCNAGLVACNGHSQLLAIR